jgi:hypothetical protein
MDASPGEPGRALQMAPPEVCKHSHCLRHLGESWPAAPATSRGQLGLEQPRYTSLQSAICNEQRGEFPSQSLGNPAHFLGELCRNDHTLVLPARRLARCDRWRIERHGVSQTIRRPLTIPGLPSGELCAAKSGEPAFVPASACRHARSTT